LEDSAGSREALQVYDEDDNYAGGGG